MRKIIIDTDIGDDIDDAFALLTALADQENDIIGITTVFKNTSQRAHIAKSLLCAAGRGDIPVFAGNEQPLREKIIRWSYEKLDDDGKIHIHHYRDGMSAARYEQGSAEDFILETAAKYPNEVTLIALGPFTNLAKAIEKDRQGFLKLKDAYIMGGHPTEPYPEWNVRVDPEAADIFFRSGLPVHCIGLNVTTRCKLFEQQISRIENCRSAAVGLVAEMMRIWIESNNPGGDVVRYPTMHDPLCVLASENRDVCTFQSRKMSVGLHGKDRARLLPDENGATLDIATDVDTKRFYRNFFEALETFEK